MGINGLQVNEGGVIPQVYQKLNFRDSGDALKPPFEIYAYFPTICNTN